MAAITWRPRRAPQCRAVPAQRLGRHTPLFFNTFCASDYKVDGRVIVACVHDTYIGVVGEFFFLIVE